MSTRFCFLFLLLVIVSALFASISPAHANNLAVENVSLADQDTGNDTYDIEFDVSWENSWFDAGAPSLTANWDAAWVFVKFSIWDGSSWSDWDHATLLNTGSVAPAGSQITFAQSGAPYVGAFIYRSSAGTGSNDWDNAQLRWDYGTDGVADGATVKIEAHAVEMVYIPQGDFEVGDTDCDNDGNIELNAGCGGSGITISTAITAALCTDGNSFDADIECADGDSIGTFCVDGDGGFDLDCDGIDNASFPTGYDDFYMMKYEISQGQYVHFLNALNRTQQNNRTASQSANQYAMSNSANVDNRSGIRNPASIPVGAITFGNDLDGITADNTTAGDGTFNENDDGENVAANFLSWMDGAAYCDWSGLRPFTELEFEKAARGGQAAVDDEYAWGNATLEAAASSLANSGEADETPNQGNMNYSSVSPDGPFRVGAFADGSSTRENAGASYYGVMELSGSLWERSVTIGNSTGRAFTGTHGDGDLSTNGFATNSDWPGYDGDDVTGATGSGFRGGSWSVSSSVARVAGRAPGASTSTNRLRSSGGRCARTSP